MTSRRRRGVVAEFYPFHSLRQMTAAKRDATSIVKRALENGDLVRRPCEQCGRRMSEAHHDDYNKPLDVKWLCRLHHRQRDADLRESRRLGEKAQRDAALPIAYLKRQARLQPVPFATPDSAPRRSLVARGCTIALVIQATTAFSDVMDRERVNECSLARRMKCSRQLLNQQFAGGFRSLKVLAAYADALGYDASVVFSKRAAETEVAS